LSLCFKGGVHDLSGTALDLSFIWYLPKLFVHPGSQPRGTLARGPGDGNFSPLPDALFWGWTPHPVLKKGSSPSLTLTIRAALQSGQETVGDRTEDLHDFMSPHPLRHLVHSGGRSAGCIPCLYSRISTPEF